MRLPFTVPKYSFSVLAVLVRWLTGRASRNPKSSSVNVFCLCTGYTRPINTHNKGRPRQDDVRVGESKKRSKWHWFSVADWIWTWQFANGWTRECLCYFSCERPRRMWVSRLPLRRDAGFSHRLTKENDQLLLLLLFYYKRTTHKQKTNRTQYPKLGNLNAAQIKHATIGLHNYPPIRGGASFLWTEGPRRGPTFFRPPLLHLYPLHWLPVRRRVDFKIAVLVDVIVSS